MYNAAQSFKFRCGVHKEEHIEEEYLMYAWSLQIVCTMLSKVLHKVEVCCSRTDNRKGRTRSTVNRNICRLASNCLHDAVPSFE